MKHVLFDNSDIDAPNVIKDPHGEVCLGLCKVCGAAESELTEFPKCPGASPYREIISDYQWGSICRIDGAVAILNNWYVATVTKSPYEAPEAGTPVLCGQMYSSPKFKDGTFIHTSRPVAVLKQHGRVIVTKSGSKYFLADVSTTYEAQYPGALFRLTEGLKEV